MTIPPGYKAVPRPCPHHVPCANPNGCSGYEIVPDPDYNEAVGQTPITITLRFSRPQEVITLMEIVAFATDDAKACYEDESDPADAVTAADYEELQDALWTCFRQQGFEIIGTPGLVDSKVLYKGVDLTYVRTPKVEAVPQQEDS